MPSRTRSKSGEPDPEGGPDPDQNSTGANSGEDDTSQSDDGADVINGAADAGEPGNDNGPGADRGGEDRDDDVTDPPPAGNAEAYPGDEALRDLEDMLNTRIGKAEEERQTVQRRVRRVTQNLNKNNLTRLTTAISQLKTAQARVKESGKEIVRYNNKYEASDRNYARR